MSVAAEDVDGLAEAFIKLSNLSSAELADLGRNGKEYCDEYFEREHVLDILEGDIKRLAGC